MRAREYVCTFVNGELVPMQELVRCRDCKYSIRGRLCMCMGWQMNPDGFCSDGSRKEDA